MATSIAGLVVIGVGLALVIAGTVLAWKEESARLKRDAVKGPVTDFVSGLAKLMDSLAKHPVGVRLVVLGIVLVFIGGVMAGVSGLATG